jgi:cation transport protein ChaC
MSDFWVFGYGSLIWNPGFESIERRPAKLYGLHRCLCIYSWVHRGTRQEPGLVLGLDRGGSCHGMAFKVDADDRISVIEYLRKRELVTNVYKEAWRPIILHNGTTERALTYVVDRTSPQYSGHLDLQKQIDIVSSAKGNSGKNCEYVLKTVQHLKTISIRDANLETIARNIGLDH